MEPGNYTRSEINSQPDAWAKTTESVMSRADDLRGSFSAGDYQTVIFTGCGSTYYLAVSAAALFQELTGLPARGLPASEIWLSPSLALTRERALLIAVSRSGETSETLCACEAWAHHVGSQHLLTLSCYPGASLASLGAINLVLPAGQEQSVAQTRAFTTLYLACTILAASWGERADGLAALGCLPAAGQRILTDYAGLARQLGSNLAFDRFYFLGSSARYGLACELSLKMKEMSLSHSEPFHFLEFRHGPKSMVTPSTLIIGLVSESNQAREHAVLDEMRELGARVLVIGETAGDVVFFSEVPECARNVLYLLMGQLLALERALARGLDPDQPRNLSAVVRLS